MGICRDEQLEYIKLWETSGLSKAEFCRQMGISYANFNAWHYKNRHSARQNALAGEQPKIVPVTLTEEKRQQNSSYLFLRIKSSVLEIPPGFPADEVKNIIKLLL